MNEVMYKDVKAKRVVLTATTIDIEWSDGQSSQYQARLLNYDFDMIKRYWGVSLSPGNEQQFYWGSDVGKKDGSRNYSGVDSPVVDALI